MANNRFEGDLRIEKLLAGSNPPATFELSEDLLKDYNALETVTAFWEFFEKIRELWHERRRTEKCWHY